MISHKQLSDTYCKLQYFCVMFPSLFLIVCLFFFPPLGSNFYTTAVFLLTFFFFVVCRVLVSQSLSFGFSIKGNSMSHLQCVVCHFCSFSTSTGFTFMVCQ